MKILIAEDDDVSRRVLQLTLAASGHDVVATKNGTEALFVLENEDAPPLAILDWMMPDMDGLEVCRRLRRLESATPVYIILLTAKTEKTDIVTGLEAGANDYITKPFDRNELQARVQVGITVVNLQQNLAARIRELENALGKVKQLQEILPICSYCKQIRNDQNYWQRVDTYISEHTDTQFSHSVCPSCYESVVEPMIRASK
ncbi:MAG TPA: response regulator [Pyrinomonadaceae bacterium]|nr:response regulator [Pyrinomonadaceae bacterium]